MYEDMSDTLVRKIRRNLYLIVSISLITHTTSIIYSLMTFKQESAGFIAIIVSSITCFFVSSSHLTIYGISILGSLYLAMLGPFYPRHQLYYITVLSGVMILFLWKVIHSVGALFKYFPGKIHASMVLGISLLVFAKVSQANTQFFPLAIENIDAFFEQQAALESPIWRIASIFSTFRVLTLGLTLAAIVFLALMRNKLDKIPLIGILVIVGIVFNYGHYFKSYADLCAYKDVDCTFYIIKLQQLQSPSLSELFQVLPAAIVMTVVLLFQQFLYLQQFARKQQGQLGEISTQNKTLAIANIISGIFGGLPICINLFATYQHFAFNQRHARQATKWVGLLQVPFSYCLYSFLSFLFESIPLFVLSTVVFTPMAYYLQHIFVLNRRHLVLICCIGAINVLGHPLLALIVASFVSICDIAELLTSAPVEIVVDRANRRSSVRVSTQKSEFVARVSEIQGDVPYEYEEYILHRIVGTVSFLNCYQHIKNIKDFISKEETKQIGKIELMLLSFRYTQSVDEESFQKLAQFHKEMKDKGINIVFSGLHCEILVSMERVKYFAEIIQNEHKGIYRMAV